MKLNLKVLMAALLFCLPLVLTSCGSDDEDTPGSTYTWLLDYKLSSSATLEEKSAALNAETAIHTVLGNAFKGITNSTVDVSKQTFTISDGNNNENDAKVKQAFWNTVTNETFKSYFDSLPTNTKIIVKRGSTPVINEKIK